jgi:hypothetical protein
MASRFDPALDSISGGESGKNVSNVNRLGAEMVQLVNATLLHDADGNARPQNAAFLTSCNEHCGQWATGQQGLYPDYNVTIDGGMLATHDSPSLSLTLALSHAHAHSPFSLLLSTL